MKSKKLIFMAIGAVIAIIIIIFIAFNLNKDSKKSDAIKNGEAYLNVVKDVLATELVNGVHNPSECVIKNDGNLNCDNSYVLIIETSGNRPTRGIIKVNNGKVTSVKNMILDGYELNGNDKLSAKKVKSVKVKPKGSYLMMTIDASIGKPFWGGNILNTDVESITITNTKKVPENVLGSWDVTEAQDGSVMAWYTDTDNDRLYELYIGGEGGVKANPDSSWAFAYFTNVETMDLKYLDTSNVTNMSYMFAYNAGNLTTLDLSSFNTSKVTRMENMFNSNIKLETINLSSFNTSNVISMINMFDRCMSLNELDLSNFDMSSVINTSYMFSRCINLKNIDLSKAQFDKVTSSDYMFSDSLKLSKIIVKDETSRKFISEKLSEINKNDVDILITT